jgi:putative colanic acid biosynthesis UDP-glucose lipid carrier transferase
MLTQKKHSQITDNLSFISKLLDAFGLSALGAACYFFYSKSFTLPNEYTSALIFISLIVFIIFPQYNLYFSWRGKSKYARSLALMYAWGVSLIVLVFISLALKTTAIYSRIWFFTFSISGYFYLIIYRLIIDSILNQLRAKGINRKKIIVYGAGVVGQDIQSRLKEHHEVGFDIEAFIDDDPNLVGKEINGVKVFSPDSLIELVEKSYELWIALPLRAEKRVLEILHMTRHLTTVIRYIPDIYNFRLLNHSITEIANIPIIEINGVPLSSGSRILKRLEDIIISLLIITFISPIILIVAILIKLTSKGPILYKQERHGWNGKTIKVYKFRSMYYEKDASFIQATKNDSRITPIGKFIRRTSIDEFPQFLNVLQGRMSIVGPRPHPVSLNHDYKEKVSNYMQRHKVKPGITGWAQINGYRGETDTIDKMEKRIELDLYYIQNWSLWLDLKIIFLTIFKGFIGKNAY